MEIILAAIVGALFGAYATHLIGARFLRKKERREARHRLVGDLVSLSYEYLAALMDLYSARMSDSSEGLNQRARECHAHLTRLEGRAMQLEVRFWQVFRERHVRAALHKLLIRFDKTRDFLIIWPLPPAEETGKALDWISNQISETTEFASKAAGIELVDKARIMFVGFRRVTPEDKRKLSFEDEPPPWLRREL